MNRSLSLLFAITISLSGCNSLQTEPEVLPPVVQTTPPIVIDQLHDYRYVMHDTNHGFGNTAMRIPAHLHVLALHHKSEYVYAKAISDIYEIDEARPPAEKPSTIVPGDGHIFKSSIDTFFDPETDEVVVVSVAPPTDQSPLVTAQPYDEQPKLSTLERAMYERYCNAGIAMSAEDWDLFDVLGGSDSVPLDMIDDCVFPK